MAQPKKPTFAPLPERTVNPYDPELDLAAWVCWESCAGPRSYEQLRETAEERKPADSAE